MRIVFKTTPKCSKKADKNDTVVLKAKPPDFTCLYPVLITLLLVILFMLPSPPLLKKGTDLINRFILHRISPLTDFCLRPYSLSMSGGGGMPLSKRILQDPCLGSPVHA